MDWFLYDRDPRHERVKMKSAKLILMCLGKSSYTQAYSEFYQISKIEYFPKISNRLKLLNMFAK